MFPAGGELACEAAADGGASVTDGLVDHRFIHDQVAVDAATDLVLQLTQPRILASFKLLSESKQSLDNSNTI